MNDKERLRTIICKHTSEMLDNPGECEIYPTTKFYNDLIEAILDAGFVHLADVELDYDKIKQTVQATWLDNRISQCITNSIKHREKHLIRKKEGV